MNAAPVLRAELPGEEEAIFAVHAEAFPSDAEARLVERLRATAHPRVSRVALEGDRPVGHVMVSPVTVASEAGPTLECGGLAPVAVRPHRQGRGIGAALVRDALAEARGLWPAVFLLGSPAWYGRLGFVPAAPLGFTYQDGSHGPAFQVYLLGEGALSGVRGRVLYHRAFDALG